MTHTDADFLAVILANPDDDTARLVYADWLDEQPQERVTCPKCGGEKEWSLGVDCSYRLCLRSPVCLRT